MLLSIRTIIIYYFGSTELNKSAGSDQIVTFLKRFYYCEGRVANACCATHKFDKATFR